MHKVFGRGLFFLFAFFAFSSTAFAASDKTSSTLHLTILPAVEVEVLGESPLTVEGTKASRSQILGLRANTDWSLSIAVLPSSLTNSLTFSGQQTGSRNLDNSFQTIPISIEQDYSWADPAGKQEVEIIYSAAPLIP